MNSRQKQTAEERVEWKLALVVVVQNPVESHFRFIESDRPHAAVLFMYVSYGEKRLNSLMDMFPPTRRAVRFSKRTSESS